MKASDNVFPKLFFAEGAAPATPAAGEVVAYAKADGLLYSKDDAGTETPLGGGGGGGSGDVVGPASSTDSHVALFDGITGKLLKDGGALGTAAFSPATAFATAAQGTTADSAVQPGDLAAVATSGAVGDLTGFPGGTTNFLRADGTFAAPPGGSSTAGKHSVPVMAGAIAPSVSGGCAALASIASAANQPDIVTLDFDTTTQEYAQFAIPMPKSWNEGTVTAQFRWSHAATTTNFGVVWNIQAVAVSDDDPIAVAFGTAQQVADTGGTTNDLYITSETPAITVAGTPAAGDTVHFRVSRVTGDGSDTMAIDARLHSVVLFITTDADTDA